MQTSFLSRLTASVCDAVTGRNDSQIILEQLEQANLFLIPLDSAQQWYRYHALFAEAMHHEAQRRLAEAGLQDLYDQASHWYEQYGLPDEAVETALFAQNYERAAMLLEEIIVRETFNNELHTMRRWLATLPEELIRSHPDLAFFYAVTILLIEDRPAQETAALLEQPLQWAEQSWQAGGKGDKLGEVLALRSLIALWQGNLAQTFATARQALELLPSQETVWRGSVLLSVGLEEMYAGRMHAAWKNVFEARARRNGRQYPPGSWDLAAFGRCLYQAREAASGRSTLSSSPDGCQADRGHGGPFR